jgi:hypothetical protein
MCLPQVIESLQNYRGVATTFIQPLYYTLHYFKRSSEQSDEVPFSYAVRHIRGLYIVCMTDE